MTVRTAVVALHQRRDVVVGAHLQSVEQSGEQVVGSDGEDDVEKLLLVEVSSKGGPCRLVDRAIDDQFADGPGQGGVDVVPERWTGLSSAAIRVARGVRDCVVRLADPPWHGS